MKFKSDVDGFITGIRFYKGPANTGTHVGNLWTSTGTLLASATFTDETPTGWQQVLFDAPVAITANTIYVASYHTNVGGYAFDGGYFANAGVDSPPLHALPAGASGGNGVFSTGPIGVPDADVQRRPTTGSTSCSRSRSTIDRRRSISADQVHDDRQLARRP